MPAPLNRRPFYDLVHAPGDYLLIAGIVHKQDEHRSTVAPQNRDARIAVHQLLFTPIVGDAQRLFVPLGDYAIDAPRAIVRSVADPNTGNSLQLAREVFGLSGILAVERREIQPAVL